LAIVQEIGTTGCWLNELDLPENATAVHNPAELAAGTPGCEGIPRSFAFILWISDRKVQIPVGIMEENVLWYRPKSLVLGVGCERGITVAALEDGLERFLAEHGYSRDSIGTLASVELKA